MTNKPKLRQASFNLNVRFPDRNGYQSHNDILGEAENFKEKYEKHVADRIAEIVKETPDAIIEVEHGFHGGDVELTLNLIRKNMKVLEEKAAAKKANRKNKSGLFLKNKK